jgi:hypothetical protein
MAVNAHVELRQRRTKFNDLLTYNGPLADSEQEEFVGLMESEAVSVHFRTPCGSEAVAGHAAWQAYSVGHIFSLFGTFDDIIPGSDSLYPDSERVPNTDYILCR